MESHVEAQDPRRYSVDNAPAPHGWPRCRGEITGDLWPNRDRKPKRAPHEFVREWAMNQDLNDAKKDEKRGGRHAGIGEPPRHGIGVGPASEREREERHYERHGQNEGRAGNCEWRGRCGLRDDDGMKGPE